MGVVSYYVTSSRMYFSTEDYIEWMNGHCNINNDKDEKNS